MRHVHLAVVHEVQDGLEVSESDAPQIKKGMCVGVSSEHGSEERRARRENNFVRLDLLIITGQSYIKEVFVFPQLTESDAYIALKVVPSQAELFVPHLNMKAEE